MNSHRRTGAAIVLCAPSGAGKTTLARLLMSSSSSFAFSISYTTRPPRPGERDGVDYHFIDHKRFEALCAQNFFAEWAKVHGNWYGTELQATIELLQSGRDVLFDIDVQGAAQLKKSLPGASFIFILPPSRQELERRLRSRGTDREEDIRLRLDMAGEEIRLSNWFDYWIVNANLEEALKDLQAVYRAISLNPARNQDLVRDLLQGWVR